MVNHCANPNCHKPLHYLREGKVFLFSGKNLPEAGDNLQRSEHYWLCGTCSRQWTMISDAREGVQLVQKRSWRKRPIFTAAAAPAS